MGGGLGSCPQGRANHDGNDGDRGKKSMSPPAAPSVLRKGDGESGRGGGENEAWRLQTLRGLGLWFWGVTAL